MNVVIRPPAGTMFTFAYSPSGILQHSLPSSCQSRTSLVLRTSQYVQTSRRAVPFDLFFQYAIE